MTAVATGVAYNKVESSLYMHTKKITNELVIQGPVLVLSQMNGYTFKRSNSIIFLF